MAVLPSVKAGIFKHLCCRNAIYPGSNVSRFPVPDEFIFWTTKYDTYQPPSYTAPHIKGQIWADPDINNNFEPKWNALDGVVNRISYHGEYSVIDKVPQNPIGRTGLRGRGILGRWGPNHAADPVVTRWRRDTDGKRVKSGDRYILQMIAIQRRDNQMWAIPGGMVEPGEKISATLKREFTEEALDGFDNKAVIDDFFSNSVPIYEGYVDDYRNTDNAWIETFAANYHDDIGEKVGKLRLSAGDDAANIKWVDLGAHLKLHANHIDIVKNVVDRLEAHW